VEIVLGTAQLTRPYGVLSAEGSESGTDDSQSVLRLAEAHAVRAIDTAPVYGGAELAIGMSGTTLPIHTKLDPLLSDVESISESLARLERNTLEVVYSHRSLSVRDIQARVPDLRNRIGQDIVEHLGVSVYEPTELIAIVDCEAITALQCPFNVFDRRFNRELLSDFVGRGGKVFIRSVFLQGLLLAPSEKIPKALGVLEPFLQIFRSACLEWGYGPVEAALHFVHHELPFASLVIGTRSVVELNEIMEASNSVVGKDFIQFLQEVTSPPWDMVDPRQW
jgi:aryl-alcohol dehydrogenase-like predicted oxidoreductase